MFIRPADDLEEQIGARLRERDVAQFIENDQFQAFELSFLPPF